MRTFIWLLLVLAACTPGPASLRLSPNRALVGEEVTAILSGADALGARVEVGGAEAEVVRAGGNTLVFRVPPVPGGPQTVKVHTSGKTLEATLGVLGQVDPARVLLRLPLGKRPTLPPGFTLLDLKDLRGCGFALAELGYGGEALGRALEELERLDPSYKADPESLWSFDSWGAEVVGALPPKDGVFLAKGSGWPCWTRGWTRWFPSFPATTLWKTMPCPRMPSPAATAPG